MLVGDIETKWLGFKTVLLDLVEIFLPSCSVEASPIKAMVIKAYCCKAKAEEKAVKNFC